MSLDVYLYASVKCDHCGSDVKTDAVLYDANITHNLGKMADAAGIYKHLWHPEDVDVTRANQLIEPLQTGIAAMEADPDYFKKYNAPNGWGLYENFVPWLKNYLQACEENPTSWVYASR